MSDRSPTFASLFEHFRESILRDLHVAFPAEVVSYDSSTQTADVRPLYSESFVEEDESVSKVPLPIITATKVLMPGAGGFRITFPVQAGDTGMCVVADRSLDAWLSQGGLQAPDDRRRHNLSDAVFYPGLKPNNSPWTGTEAAAISIGKDGGVTDAVALASKVKTALDDLQAVFNAHTHPTAPPGPASVPSATATASTAVASLSVKIKE